MPDDGQVDAWADAHTAQEEKLAGLPPRAMLTRAEAMAKADEFLRGKGSLAWLSQRRRIRCRASGSSATAISSVLTT